MLAVVTTLICALLAADIVGSLVEAEVPEPRAVAAVMPPPAPAAIALPPDGAFVARNMFCSTCEPALASATASSPYRPEAHLIATSIGDVSVATVRVPASEAQGSYGVGDVIPGIGTVERIGFVSIDVVNKDGQRGSLSLFAGAATPAEPAAATTREPSAFDDRIRKIDDTTFEVERALVRDLVSGSMQTAGARISPIVKDGKVEGLRLFGVRPSSLAGSLGLVNGDILQAINNQRIENANTLLELYAQLDTLGTVELAGTRKGKPLTLTLRLR